MSSSFIQSASTSVTSCIPGNGDLLITCLDGSTVRVDPHARRLLNEIRAAFSRHLVISEAQATALAVWTMHTHVYRQFQFTPRLAIISPEKRCGKSTLIDLLNALCCEPDKMDNATAAVIYRTVDSQPKLTLLIDEADSFLSSAEGLRGVLNSGFEVSGKVKRSRVARRGDYEPAGYKSFAPAAIASIGELPDTIMDRAVPIHLRRKLVTQKVESIRPFRESLRELQGEIAAWAETADFKDYPDPSMPGDFDDRQADISVPLLAIADLAGCEWPDRVRDALSALFSSNKTDSPSGMLLADIRSVFNQTNADKLSSSEICSKLGDMEDRPWPDFSHGHCITPPQMARLLKSFGIGPRDIRLDNKAGIKGYLQADFMDAWSRYLPPEKPESGVTH